MLKLSFLNEHSVVLLFFFFATNFHEISDFGECIMGLLLL